MSEPPTTELSVHEKSVAEQAHELFEDLDVAELERVLADVQRRRAADRARREAVAKSGIMFSRGIASPLGKLNCVLKTKVDEHTHTLFLQQCAMQRTDASNQIRNCVYALVHGKSYDQMALEKVNHDAQRTQALVKLIGPFGGPELAE